MSDSESAAPVPHPSTGGKSLQTVQRPRYKSWRKKFRKMRANFETVLEANKNLFKDEQKLEGIAKRLREELDGLLELCLDLNNMASIPPELRFNVTRHERKPLTKVVPKDLTAEYANELMGIYSGAVSRGDLPPLDLMVIKEHIHERLSKLDVEKLEVLDSAVSHPYKDARSNLPIDMLGEHLPGFLTTEQEQEYLQRLDAGHPDPLYPLSLPRAPESTDTAAGEERTWAELTTREQDRTNELQNPHSQHRWIKQHYRPQVNGPGAADIDDNESLASESKPPRRRASAKHTLAKQLGGRAMERAREGFSPGVESVADDDQFMWEFEDVGKRRKSGRDQDGPYRSKTKGSGSAKGKRKRSGEDVPAGSGKKPKVESAE